MLSATTFLRASRFFTWFLLDHLFGLVRPGSSVVVLDDGFISGVVDIPVGSVVVVNFVLPGSEEVSVFGIGRIGASGTARLGVVANRFTSFANCVTRGFGRVRGVLRFVDGVRLGCRHRRACA